MPNLHPIPEADLPPLSPERRFVYCPNPLAMTDADVETVFPRQRRLEHFRDLARDVRLATQHVQPTAYPAPALGKAALKHG